METKLGIPKDQVPEYRSKLYADHGTTVAGLVVRFFVHPLPGSYLALEWWSLPLREP